MGFCGRLFPLPHGRAASGSRMPSEPPLSKATPWLRKTLTLLNQEVGDEWQLSVPAGFDYRPFKTDRMISQTQMLAGHFPDPQGLQASQ